MRERLIDLIEKLRTDKAWLSDGEEKVKQGVILHILSLLGWDDHDTSEVNPEYSVGGGRVDYALCVRGNVWVFLEAKKPVEELKTHEDQLLNYAYKQGIPLAVLTNGSKWWMYLPTATVPWEQRKFYSIGIFEQEPADVASKFVDFLSKENVASGAAVEKAKELHESTKRQRVIEQSLPEAWNSLVGESGESHEMLVELIIETTEAICGYKPDGKQVEHFLSRHKERLSLERPAPEPIHPDRAVGKPPSPRPVQPPSPPEGTNVSRYGGPLGHWIGKHPQSYSFLGQERQVQQWNKLLVGVCEIVYSRHTVDFHKCLVLRGTKRRYFSRDQSEMATPLAIPGSGIWVETNLNAMGVVGLCNKLLDLFGHRPSDLQINAG
jgi:hypothetical protein